MTIKLGKGNSIDLTKQAPGLSRIFMGLGWDVAKSKGMFGGLFGGGGSGDSIDLDASVIGFDNRGNKVDAVWFRQLAGFGGAVKHSGDNRTGDGDGDDETINIDLTRLPANVHALVFTVNSFTGQTFERVENATCRLVDATKNTEIARIELASKGGHTGVVMAVVKRTANGGWEMKAIGDTTQARTFESMGPQLQAALR